MSLSAKTRITERQKAAIENFGFIPPPTKIAAGRLLDWVFKGPYLLPFPTLQERIALVKAYEKRFVGKRVRATRPNTHGEINNGVVLYLICKTPGDINSTLVALRDQGVKNPKVLPFRAHVAWDNGKKSACIISHLYVIEG